VTGSAASADEAPRRPPASNGSETGGHEIERQLARMEAALRRIERASPRVPPEARTAPDPASGEVWGRAEVLGHVAELIPYWHGEVAKVLDAGGGGVPFGRVKATPERVARIEEHSRRDPSSLLADARAAFDALCSTLRSLPESSFALTGTHQTKGPMTVAAIVEEFLAAHLEEHADQLEALAELGPARPPR
jgi:hypothetical protein